MAVKIRFDNICNKEPRICHLQTNLTQQKCKNIAVRSLNFDWHYEDQMDDTQMQNEYNINAF
jgi:hypothetical protein